MKQTFFSIAVLLTFSVALAMNFKPPDNTERLRAIGPAEYLRSKIRSCLYGVIKDWKKVIFEENETITILYKDGTEKVYKSPYKKSAAT